MSDMKLIMESWKQYSALEEDYDEVLAFIFEHYYGDLLTEGLKGDILSGMKSLVIQFGKKAVTAALVASIATGALAPGIAAAADTVTGVDLPVAAQQMDAEEAKKIIDMSEVGQELKDIFGKDGKISKLLKKKSVDDAPDEAPAPAEEAKGELLGTGTSVNAQIAKEMALDRAADNGYVGGDEIIGELTMNPDPDFGHNYGTYTYTIHKAPADGPADVIGVGKSMDRSVAKDQALSDARASGYKAGDNVIEKLSQTPDGKFIYRILKAPAAEAN